MIKFIMAGFIALTPLIFGYAYPGCKIILKGSVTNENY